MTDYFVERRRRHFEECAGPSFPCNYGTDAFKLSNHHKYVVKVIYTTASQLPVRTDQNPIGH